MDDALAGLVDRVEGKGTWVVSVLVLASSLLLLLALSLGSETTRSEGTAVALSAPTKTDLAAGMALAVGPVLLLLHGRLHDQRPGSEAGVRGRLS